ncbi:MAG: 3-dehydroquinate synthase [Clostridia bacterium]|nr:3-dehydroquinate synthase [Clostridia bacterium]
MTLRMELGENSYDIVIERGLLQKAGKLLDLDRKVLIVTDDGVPEIYAKTVAKSCKAPTVVTIPQGEASKSFPVLENLLSRMLAANFTRTDCVCAVGGGVVGDLSALAAALYMRGIDFYNIPTTLLSQADSSIGGKTGIDLDGVKNVVGVFRQPKKVLIDPDTLSTLPPRQIAAGHAEIVKAGLIADATLFSLYESGKAENDLVTALSRALAVKKAVVEQDEKESGLRRILNFGHTVGHGIESVTGLLHGECVAVGMIPMCAPAVRERLIPVLTRLGLPTAVEADPDKIYAALLHDKKAAGGRITAVLVNEIGSCEQISLSPEALREKIETVVKQ